MHDDDKKRHPIVTEQNKQLGEKLDFNCVSPQIIYNCLHTNFINPIIIAG